MRLRTVARKVDNGRTQKQDTQILEKLSNDIYSNFSEKQLDLIMGVDRETVTPTELILVEGNSPPGSAEIRSLEASTDVLSMESKKKPVSSGVNLVRNRPMSCSDRELKALRMPAVKSCNVKSSAGSIVKDVQRPTSHIFSEYEVLHLNKTLPDPPDTSNLLRLTSGSQPVLTATDEAFPPDRSSGLLARYLSLHASTPHISPVESLLQKFRKSFAHRFQKRKTESMYVSTGANVSGRVSQCSLFEPLDPNDVFEDEKVPQSQTAIRSNCSPTSSNGNSSVSFQLGSLEKVTPEDTKKRKKEKKRWHSIVSDTPETDIQGRIPTPENLRSSVSSTATNEQIGRQRRNTSSSSEQSPKITACHRPQSITEYSQPESTSLGSVSNIWRSTPVRLCRVHSRLLMCRHRTRYRLRRTISQPVELEVTGSSRTLGEISNVLSDQEVSRKGSSASDDEASSDSELYHSLCCSPTRRSATCWELSSEGNLHAEALWDHVTTDPEELSFQAGDMVEVIDITDKDWWWGTKTGNSGWFPAAFVKVFGDAFQPYSSVIPSGTSSSFSSCKISLANLSIEQIRANVVQEIVATERDYVKHLTDVVEGYLRQVQKRPDMFYQECILTIFGNIEQIYNFQSQFLKELENCLQETSPQLSEIGNCFLNHKEDFKMYSEYCNNHPLAVSQLQELYCDSKYLHFFEACRLLQEMIDISLDGFLLTPIQRICKYPLQLAELLKYTEQSHPDYEPVCRALDAMKEVAQLVNERKRRMEYLEKVAEWQRTIDCWEGPDILVSSSILIHHGEVTRSSSTWSRDLYLFLFDHQLIYCKKDLLKRHTYVYKGRINLDTCDVIPVEDIKDPQFGVTVKNAWKMHCKHRNKWFLFYTKTAAEKNRWTQAFQSERQRVKEDEEQGFVVTEQAKKAARLAVLNKRKPKRPRAKLPKGPRSHPDTVVTELLLDPPSAKARSGSLPSNIHPELAAVAGAKLSPSRKKGSGWFHFGSGKKPRM